MSRAGAEAPASGRPLRFEVQVDDASGAVPRDLEPMIGSIDAYLAEAERVDEERFLLAHVTHRQHRPEEAARRDVSGDLRRRPRIPDVAALFDHLEEEPRWMTRPQVLRPEPLLDAAVVGAVAFEVVLPERNRANRHRIARARELAGAGAAGLARIRKTRGDG